MKKISFALILIILTIVILGAVGYFAYKNYVPKPQDSKTVYKLTLWVINKKNHQPNDNGDLTVYLANRLHLNQDEFNLFYDQLQYSSQFEWYWLSTDWKGMEFYLLAKNGAKPKLIQKSDNFIEIKLQKTDGNLIPYLKNPKTDNLDSKYCQLDSDCIIRANLCSTGSYNQYTIYIDTFGCGGGHYDEQYYPDEQCHRRITYSNPKCQNNQCISDENLSSECIPYDPNNEP